MKKILLSILLILLFAFVACPVLADRTTVETDKETFLNQLISMPSGITSETKTLTRGKYAEALVALMGQNISVMPETITSKFFDVYGVNAQTMAIVYLEQRNIVSGNETGMFKPEQNIKIEEAVKMLVTAMGYDTLAHKYGGYPNGYIQVANEISLLKSITYNRDELLTGKQMIDMFYNALHANIMKIASNKGGNLTFNSNEDTFLTGILEIGVYRGVVDATEYTGLYSYESASKNCVKIDGTEFTLDTKTKDIIDYLGYRIDAYYKVIDGENILVAYEFVKNDVLRLDASEIDEVKDYRLVYNVNGKSKSIQLDRSISVIYNGEYTDIYTEEMLTPNMGSVTLIANSSSGDYDVVVVESYKNYVVSGIDESNMLIYDRLEPDKIIELEKNNLKYFIYDNKGLDISLSDIPVNSVLSIAMSAGGDYAKMIVSLDMVEGTFTYENTDDEIRKFLIDGEYYPVSEDFRQITPVSGYGGRFYLDFEGNVVFYISSVASDEWKFGYIINTFFDEDSDTYKTKMLQDDNLVNVYNFARKVRVNSASYNSSELKNSSDLYYNEAFQRQFVTYKTNANNEITIIQTATEDTRSNIKRLDSTSKTNTGTNMRYRSSIQCFNYQVYLNNHTKVFVVPEVTESYDSELFRMETSGYLTDNRNYNIQAFALGENMSDAAAIVLTEGRNAIPGSLSDWTNLFVVKQKKSVVDDNDEIKTEFVLVRGGSEVALKITDAALANVAFGTSSGAYDVEVGDVVRYSVNAKNEINYLQLIYDVSSGTYQKANSNYINTSFTGETSMLFGTAYNRPDDVGSRVRIDVGTAEKPNIQVLPIERFSATLVDMSGRIPTVTALQSAAQIRTSDVYGVSKASKIIYMAHQGAPASMVVYVE